MPSWYVRGHEEFVLSFPRAWGKDRPHGVKVMALCPGVTDTNFFEASRMQRPPARVSQTADDVVDVALRALARGKSSVISGWTNLFMVETERLVPRSLVLRIAGSMLRSQQGEKKALIPLSEIAMTELF